MDKLKAVKCKICNLYEFADEMRWTQGKRCCRRCFKGLYGALHQKPYTWKDCEGPFPSDDEIRASEEGDADGKTANP